MNAQLKRKIIRRLIPMGEGKVRNWDFTNQRHGVEDDAYFCRGVDVRLSHPVMVYVCKRCRRFAPKKSAEFCVMVKRVGIYVYGYAYSSKVPCNFCDLLDTSSVKCPMCYVRYCKWLFGKKPLAAKAVEGPIRL